MKHAIIATTVVTSMAAVGIGAFFALKSRRARQQTASEVSHKVLVSAPSSTNSESRGTHDVPIKGTAPTTPPTVESALSKSIAEMILTRTDHKAAEVVAFVETIDEAVAGTAPSPLPVSNVDAVASAEPEKTSEPTNVDLFTTLLQKHGIEIETFDGHVNYNTYLGTTRLFAARDNSGRLFLNIPITIKRKIFSRDVLRKTEGAFVVFQRYSDDKYTFSFTGTIHPIERRHLFGDDENDFSNIDGLLSGKKLKVYETTYASGEPKDDINDWIEIRLLCQNP